MRSKSRFTFSWPRVVQAFVGLFFMAAAYEKLTASFFGAQNAPLRADLDWWLSEGWPAPGYRQFLELMLPYANILGAGVIACQMAAGIMLLCGFWKRPAAVILFFIQLNIFLATCMFGIGFITFVGISLWLAVYYFWERGMTEAKWRGLTWALIIFGVLFSYRRFTMGDGWPSAYVWQGSHFAAEVMSISPVLKAFIVSHSSAILWASMWWIQAALIVLMLTKYRIYVGAVWLLFLIARVEIWFTAVTSEGVLWVLTVFVWLAYEEMWQRHHGPLSLFPGLSKDSFVRFLKGL